MTRFASKAPDINGMIDRLKITLNQELNELCPDISYPDFYSSDDVLTLLIHLGYLTYDFDTKTAWIPNKEVQKEFINCIEDGGCEEVMNSLRRSDELLKATLSGDSDTVTMILEEVHQQNTSIITYNNELSLSVTLSLAYYSAKNNSADNAIEQIKAKNYTDKLSAFGGEILLVVINYDDSKGHSCVIEKMLKP